jgi:putative membrane-bound dehydrogenase-like protein
MNVGRFFLCLGLIFASCFPGASHVDAADKNLKVLFLGDKGHHRPADRAAQLIPILRSRGIAVEYTESMAVLEPETLNQYDALVIYANITEINPEQEKALLEYVRSGHGFVPLHCASFCFLNSPAYIALVGGQFQRHGGQEFITRIAEPDHPIMKNYDGFRSWDETYIHHKHNSEGRLILEYREQGEQAEGQTAEPWTWVRNEGKGRVFYTAWGHDERTWGQPGFQALVERGIRWSCGQDLKDAPPFTNAELFQAPVMTELSKDVEPFKYVDVGNEIPNYTPSKQWGVQGKPLSAMQEPLSPQEAIKHYVYPKGFEFELFAAEPELGGKPIFMTWDHRGRLWVCETMDYPNELQPGNKGRDRIRICEDSNGDGVADKFTVFAEQLSIPTAIAFCRGGAFVQNGTETLYLKDTNGDDKADIREVVIEGWAMGDTHGGISNFQYGLDNWYWGMQGYNFSEPVTAAGKQDGFRQGFWRFEPRGGQNKKTEVGQVEFLRSTNNNTWGLGFSEEGLVFGSTANRNPSDFMPIPNRYYEKVRGWSPSTLQGIADTHLFKPITDKIRQVDQHGGYTAGAGHALYTARTYPKSWWNRTAFVCGPTGHLVGTFVLVPDGAGFKSYSPNNLVAADDEWAAPIMAEVGPDGNVWVLDWYNYIVQHNPTPNGFQTGKGNAYETKLRDKRHGRIYRLTYPGAKSEDTVAPKLSENDPAGLVKALSHSNMFWRKHAQRLLVERGNKDVVPALIKNVADTSVDSIGLNAGVIHSLWTLHGLGAIQPRSAATEAVLAALKHPSAGVRRNALMVLPQDQKSLAAILDSGILNDSHAQVRLAALLAMADQSATEAAGAAVAKLSKDAAVMNDRWLADAVTAAAATHAIGFLQYVSMVDERNAAPQLPERTRGAVRIIAEHIARGRPDATGVEGILAALEKADAQVAGEIIAGLTAGWPNDYQTKLSEEQEKKLLELLERMATANKAQLVQLSQRMGSTALADKAREIAAELAQRVADNDLAVEDRISAAEQAIGISPNDNALVASLLEQITPQCPPELAKGIIEGLGASRAKDTGAKIVDQFGMLTPVARQAAIRLLMARADLINDMLKAIEGGKIQLADLGLEQKQALLAHPKEEVRKAAEMLMKSGGGLPNPDRQRVLDQYFPITQKKGDPMAGKPVFTKHCALCHQIAGEGVAIGPDLTGMAVHPKAELLTHILDPSRSVEGNFRTYTVQTTDGLVLTGMLAGESRTSIELIDSQGKRQSLLREDIEQLVGSTKSLMPEGFESQMTEADMTNLLEFLTSKGRYVPLPIGKVATAVSTKNLFHDGPPGPDRMVFPDWAPKTFEGVPFVLVDPQVDRVPNIILLNGPQGTLPPKMPKQVSIPCNMPVKKLHLLSGVSGWGHPAIGDKSVSMIVRLKFEDGKVEEHKLLNGVHFADYIRKVDVDGSKHAYRMTGGQQLRYLAIEVKSQAPVQEVELIKGEDDSAPIVMAITAEGFESEKH